MGSLFFNMVIMIEEKINYFNITKKLNNEIINNYDKINSNWLWFMFYYPNWHWYNEYFNLLKIEFEFEFNFKYDFTIIKDLEDIFLKIGYWDFYYNYVEIKYIDKKNILFTTYIN